MSEFKFAAPPLENLLQPILWRHYDPYNCANVPPEMMGRPWMQVAEFIQARDAQRMSAPAEDAVLTLDQIESIVEQLRNREGTFGYPLGALRYERQADGLWYVFDSAGAVVFIADDIGYMQLTGEEPRE